PIDHSDFRYVRAEGIGTFALSETTRGQIRLRQRGGSVHAPSRRLRTPGLCRGTCCAGIDRAAEPGRDNFVARSSSPQDVRARHLRSWQGTASYKACRIPESGKTSAIETCFPWNPVHPQTKRAGRFPPVTPYSYRYH